MHKKLFILLFCFCLSTALWAVQRNPKPVVQLVERVGGKGAASRFEFLLDKKLGSAGKDHFVLTTHKGKPCIKGNSHLSLATGFNWYLNHHAHINLTWNRPTAPLSKAHLPLPQNEEHHEASVAHRYYLNYCTISYSMAFWTQERWLQEIDWMAMHGINMPLMLVGLEGVWEGVLQELGYSESEIQQFIAGPGFQAWWLMNNLEGWGGPVSKPYIKRQNQLAKVLLKRMRSFDMEPVLPGYSGMVPNGIDKKLGWKVADIGLWCHFRRPTFLSPTDENFAKMAKIYYKHLRRILGSSRYYSMDPFHEGGNTTGIDIPMAFRAICDNMLAERKDAVWVIQSWNENPRHEGLRAIDKGKLLVLDLFSDGEPKWQSGYAGHDFAYCMLHNFGGRTGLHGRITSTIQGFYDSQKQLPQQCKGIGATPEGIENNPVLYDLIFELPWIAQAPDAQQWLSQYVTRRYGQYNAEAQKAWQLLHRSVYTCNNMQQGTSEPIVCARPALRIKSVSTWSTSRLYYDPQDVVEAARHLLKAGSELRGENYEYDLVDVVRQALTDLAIPLLDSIRSKHEQHDKAQYQVYKQDFLSLILDLDQLLATHKDFRLGNYTQQAQEMGKKELPTQTNAANWLEGNLRKLITVWGTREAANQGGLHDYSNREWAGLLRDFHYPRWQLFFEHLEQGKPQPDWFEIESAWTEKLSLQYSAQPTGNPVGTAQRLFKKWLEP